MELQLVRSTVDPAYFHGFLMLPTLREGDEVEVEAVSWNEVRAGDVVTYRDGERFPTRRVTEIKRADELFVVMGDSVRPRRRWLVPFEDVIGRVARRRRDGKWMTTGHWRWRLQRAMVLGRYRLAATVVGDVVRWARRTIGRRGA